MPAHTAPDTAQPATGVKAVAPVALRTGLTSEEAGRRLAKDGPNARPGTSTHLLRNAVMKFWAPVPWLLEASIILEVVLHKYFEAGVNRHSSGF